MDPTAYFRAIDNRGVLRRQTREVLARINTAYSALAGVSGAKPTAATIQMGNDPLVQVAPLTQRANDIVTSLHENTEKIAALQRDLASALKARADRKKFIMIV